MVGYDAHAGLTGEAVFSPFSKPKPDAVIAAQRVAAGEDEASGFDLGYQCFERARLQPRRRNSRINEALAAEGRFAVEKNFPQGLKPVLLSATWRHD
jgi:hypothetical protein